MYLHMIHVCTYTSNMYISLIYMIHIYICAYIYVRIYNIYTHEGGFASNKPSTPPYLQVCIVYVHIQFSIHRTIQDSLRFVAVLMLACRKRESTQKSSAVSALASQGRRDSLSSILSTTTSKAHGQVVGAFDPRLAQSNKGYIYIYIYIFT